MLHMDPNLALFQGQLHVRDPPRRRQAEDARVQLVISHPQSLEPTAHDIETRHQPTRIPEDPPVDRMVTSSIRLCGPHRAGLERRVGPETDLLEAAAAFSRHLAWMT